MAASVNVRGKNFNGGELRQLCLSLLEIMQDAVKGNWQKKNPYWMRITEHYNKNRSPEHAERPLKSLETKWGDVRKDVTKFMGAYEQVENAKYSGDNKDDTFRKACELFKQKGTKKDADGNITKKGKDFTYEGCWRILKHNTRWMNPLDISNNKRKRSSVADVVNGADEDADAIYNVESPTGDDTQVTDSPTSPTKEINYKVRPMGNKAAKAKAKEEKQVQNSHRIAAEARHKMAEAATERLKTFQAQSLFMLLSMPGFEDDPRRVAYLAAAREREILRLQNQLDTPSIGQKSQSATHRVPATGAKGNSISIQQDVAGEDVNEVNSNQYQSMETCMDARLDATPPGSDDDGDQFEAQMTAVRTSLPFA